MSNFAQDKLQKHGVVPHDPNPMGRREAAGLGGSPAKEDTTKLHGKTKTSYLPKWLKMSSWYASKITSS